MFGRIRRHHSTQETDQIAPQRGKGQSLVEMALIAPLLILFLIGVFEVGWAIRGYIVLVNADREATRFAARGRYLDFAETDPNDIGYGVVLSHTLGSISSQLPYDVLSGDPNGTLIISHYLVDTARPCHDPPCNDDCDADNQNHHGGCDCTSSERREEDYPYDDLVLYPGGSGYEHFAATYGISRPSRVNPDALITQLKEENDAFNCALNLKDPSAPWSVNSVIVVESYYDQPQLLGVPIISNHFTDPVPLYAHTMMRISSDSRETTTSHGEGCELLPIAIHTDTVRHLNVGDFTGHIREGTDSGDFGWLRWTDDTDAVASDPNSEGYLAEEILNPRLSMNDYREPYDDGPPYAALDPCTDDLPDTVLNTYDCVWALTGNVNSNGVARTEMEARFGQIHRLPVWDAVDGTGSNTIYRIVRFALIRLEGLDFTGSDKHIWGTFMGWDDDACRGNGH